MTVWVSKDSFAVLGAGAGIGSATCRALSGAGAQVLCVDREPSLAEAIAAEVRGVPYAADVTQRSAMEGVMRTAREKLSAPLTGLVDIVGVSRRGTIAETDDAMWDHQLDTILRHAYLALQLGGAEIARAGGGAMVFVGSLSGRACQCVAYGAARRHSINDRGGAHG